MQLHITCAHCGSGIQVLPSQQANAASCDICKGTTPLVFHEAHERGELIDCPVCQRKDFYQQKDFNRKIGVILFVIAACLVPWTYGFSLLALYLMDVFLFRRLNLIAICYKCRTVFREVTNIQTIPPYDHEMNDRIVYSDHDFKGKPLSH